MDFKEKTVSSKLKYHCSFLDLYEDEVLLPNGNKSSRVFIDHLGAACVLPVTKDGMIVLTKQYRYPIKKVSLEVPAGKKDVEGEDGLLCAKRELEEETSYVSNNFHFVQKIYNCLGYSNEAIDCYIALDCTYKKDSISADEDEFVEVVLYRKEDCKKMVMNGEIEDVKTVLLLQHYFLTYDGGLE